MSFNIKPIEKDTSGDTLIINEGTPGLDGQDNGNIPAMADFSVAGNNDKEYQDDDDDMDSIEIPFSQMQMQQVQMVQ